MNNYTSKKYRGKPVYRSDGRVVGWIRNDSLIKHVYGSKHMLRYPRGWAWDTCALRQAWENKVRYIKIFDKETRTKYRIKFTDFMQNCEKIDRGHGKQRVCPIQYFQIKRPKQ